MSDSDIYYPSASSSESWDTSYSKSKEEMTVASTVQPEEEELSLSSEDFEEDWLIDWFLACRVQVETRITNHCLAAKPFNQCAKNSLSAQVDYYEF